MTEGGCGRLRLTRRRLLAGAAASFVIGGSTSDSWADGGGDPFPLPPFDYSKLKPEFRPAVVAYRGRQYPGTIIVDTSAHQISLILEGGKAMRWGCAVGMDGFRRAGVADIGRKVM